MEPLDVTLADVVAASRRIGPHLSPTPVVRSPWLSEVTGAEVHLKLETLQATGSFKVRGALCASAGNHAQGVAWGATMLGISAMVVVPEGTPGLKREAIRRLGAELIVAGASYDEAEDRARAVQRETLRTLIHAFLDPKVVAGQGTLALETFAPNPDWDSVIVPAGGGGLIAGVGAVVKAMRPESAVLGVQSEASAPWVRSFATGHVESVTYEPTLAEGLAGRIDAANFALVRRVTDEMVEVEEIAIARAMAGLARHQHLLVEGAGAVGVAALMTGRIRLPRGSRGNVGADRLGSFEPTFTTPDR